MDSSTHRDTEEADADSSLKTSEVAASDEKPRSPATMNASPTSTRETETFTTARDFYTGEDSPERGADTPRAKAVVWYDQATPLFVCCACVDHADPLEWEGSETVEDYDERRAATYEQLWNESPECDVCAGNVPEKVDL